MAEKERAKAEEAVNRLIEEFRQQGLPWMASEMEEGREEHISHLTEAIHLAEG